MSDHSTVAAAPDGSAGGTGDRVDKATFCPEGIMTEAGCVVQDAGEIPIGLCVGRRSCGAVHAADSESLSGVQVVRMLQGDLGNDGPRDGGGSGSGPVPGPPDPTHWSPASGLSRLSTRADQAS
jgi:hypothetical protein